MNFATGWRKGRKGNIEGSYGNKSVVFYKGAQRIRKSKKFVLFKKLMNPSRFRTHPAVPELCRYYNEVKRFGRNNQKLV